MQMKAKANGVNPDQHNQLMDEFKKAHQKMFKNGNRTVEDDLVSVWQKDCLHLGANIQLNVCLFEVVRLY